MSDYFLPFAYFQGKIIPAELAKVSIMTNALQYGNAVFTGIRGYQSSGKKSSHIFRLADHYNRFLNSLKILNELRVARVGRDLDIRPVGERMRAGGRDR